MASERLRVLQRSLVTALFLASGTWVLGDPAFAQGPPPPPGGAKGHWVLLSDTTGSTFAPDAAQPGGGSLLSSGEGAAGRTSALTGDTQKGAASAAKESTGKTLRITGATAARGVGSGAFLREALLEFASKSPDLYDSANAKAWKLSRVGDDLAFAPYDASGALRASGTVVVVSGSKSGEAGGSKIVIGTYRSGRLRGSFRNGITNTQSAELSAR